MTKLGVSVVVPVFRSSQTLEPLVRRISEALESLGEFEILLVDDGSPDPTWATIQGVASRSSCAKGLRLSRNFGQHCALVAGTRAARFPIVITLDDDLQNPPEEIPKLLDALVAGQFDVVYGVPRKAERSFPRRIAGMVTKRSLAYGLGQVSALEISSFRAFRTQLRDAFSSDLGTNVSLDALLTWGGSRFGSVLVRHDPRKVGSSTYSYARLLRFAVDTTTGYSAAPLQVASGLGFATAVLGLLAFLWVVVHPLIVGRTVEGFPFLASTVAIFSGVQLLTLGVIGEYLARMHFRIMRKPTYVIRETTDTGLLS